MPTKTIKLDSAMPRILLIVLGLLCLLFMFLATKWFLGNSISTQVIQKEVAEFAVSLAPSDPQTHFATGVLYEQSFQAEDMSKSLEEYEKAVALSPNNYLLWIAYGKAKERNGDSEGAEKALLKALELAPNYAQVHWVYGNILLRQDKNKEAFVAIRRAVESDAKFATPAATVAWDLFEGDIDEVKKSIGNSAPVQSALATFLAGQKRFGESLKIWSNLPEEDRKTTFLKDSEKILNQLITEKKYRSALPIKKLLAAENSKDVLIGKVTNGGFEIGIDNAKIDVFKWNIAKGNQPKIGPNVEQKHAGEKSLALVFNSPIGKDFRSISQIVAVESDTSYAFEAFYKSKLETSATVKWEVVDASSGNVLASTNSFEENASDWKSLNVSFKTNEDTEGIIIRLVREKCTSADCSISGTIWLDDISLN